MRTMRNVPRCRAGHLFEADYCSACGLSGHNEDYALVDSEVGVCVADGVGGAPLGDAVSRLLCHTVMGALRDGCSAEEALEVGRCRLKSFLRTVDSPRSGASVMVLRCDAENYEVAWLGDVALFALGKGEQEPQLITSFDLAGDESSHAVNVRSNERPMTAFFPKDDICRFALCTDGVWRDVSSDEIASLLKRDISVREAAARLVLRDTVRDDSTAVVVSPRGVEE
ncbi:MAG: protein phosphatase 2C domain-containing protein [Atopobiaceae bacterium]|nr:protein phosphatase 2C domain-containing protein [Atopobiaceae bacterium]